MHDGNSAFCLYVERFSHAGYDGGGYCWCVCFLLGIFWPDILFSLLIVLIKKKVLILNTLFLGLITFLTIFASEPYQLILLRIIAGLFGGVTLGVGIGILLNNSPESMRGRVLGIAFSSFSFVSILGIPLCLYLAESFNWQVSFLFIVILCIVSLPLILFFIPGTEKVKK
ncbi:hypothetical protein C6H68_19390 [Photorhabdus luminescens]|nr:hypothetical protein C6H68_19390 [Photorhabdus luminescens]